MALKNHSIANIHPLRSIYGALAHNNFKLENYELSIVFYKKKKDELIKEYLFGDDDLIDFNINMASCFMQLHKNEEALTYIEDVLKNKNIDFSGYRVALSIKSQILEAENNFTEAVSIDTKLFDISKIEILSLFPILSNAERETRSKVHNLEF